jgi:hypothetical protein
MIERVPNVCCNGLGAHLSGDSCRLTFCGVLHIACCGNFNEGVATSTWMTYRCSQPAPLEENWWVFLLGA